jgi:hypothetical protein
MADEPAKTKAELNPHAWVTREKFLEFMAVRGVSMRCELCGSDKSWWIDTGSEGGYVPRIASMPMTPNGKADTSDTFQMPVVRAVCLNCGNIRLHALHALDLWQRTGAKTVEVAVQMRASGQLNVNPEVKKG